MSIFKTIVFLIVVGLLGWGVFYISENSESTTPALETEEMTVGTAVVDSVEISILESFPVQVNVIARGNYPDGCTSLGNITTTKIDNLFSVNVETKRPVDAVCTQALVPFEEVISLDALGLLKGVYDVDVNGAKGTFEISVDNISQEDLEEPNVEDLQLE